MEKQEWIEGRIVKLKTQAEKWPQYLQISDNYMEWIADMFDSAWERGAAEGREEAYENVQKWRVESNGTISR